MWRSVSPAFERDYKVVLFDHVGSGRSDRNAFRRERHDRLEGYADDLLEVLAALDLPPAILVAHSVSANIGIIAACRQPERFSRLVLMGPSPCFLNDGDYVGGFERGDIDEFLELMETNQSEWSQQLAPLAMANSDRPELARELALSLGEMDPFVVRHFARATFRADYRELLPNVTIPTLVLQCTDDAIAPIAVGQYVHRTIPGSDYVLMKATGHLPHLSAPTETIDRIQDWLPKPKRTWEAT
ncbi:MAG: hypothetical protein RLZZ200_1557 [Pseudomonadota bacterium]|jgi:sigma-B regulation protein RsbQ